MPSYILSEPYKQRVDNALATVEGMPSQQKTTLIQTRFETLQQPQKVFRICTFTGVWSINTSKAVTFRGVTSTPNTVSAVNLFFPVTQSPPGETDCAIAKDGTAWYLIDVPLEEKTAVFAASTANISVAQDISLSATLDTSNCAISIAKTVTTASITILGSTFTSTFFRLKSSWNGV